MRVEARTAQGEPLVAIAPAADIRDAVVETSELDLEFVRKDLREVHERRTFGRDESRAEAVAKRHARGHQTARENIAQVCDPGTFMEYGEFAIAAQRHRRSQDDLIRNTTGDGIITGLGLVNGDEYGPDRARCAFAVGDYMVLAGTQGTRHQPPIARSRARSRVAVIDENANRHRPLWVGRCVAPGTVS